jgi:hypothetical protein
MGRIRAPGLRVWGEYVALKATTFVWNEIDVEK